MFGLWKKREREERRTGFVKAPPPKPRPAIALSIVAGTFLFLVVLTLFVVAFGRVSVLEYMLTVMPQRSLQGVNILIAGVDAAPTSQRSDTIMIVHLDKLKNRIGVLSIPRDTRVNVDGMGYTKINHAFARGGIDLLQKTVSGFLGIPVHHYIQIDSKGVERIIDDMGGIQTTVDENMYYTDRAGDLFINLRKGPHTLTGQEAVAYLRFRGDAHGDIGRIARQQNFVQDFTKKIFGSSHLFLSPKIMTQMMGNIDTSLSATQIISFAVQFNSALRAGNIEISTIPGEAGYLEGISYWKPNVADIPKVVNTKLFGINDIGLVEPLANSSVSVEQIHTPDHSAINDLRRRVTLREANQIEVQQGVNSGVNVKALRGLKVEVLNGNGRPGGAQELARFLKSKDVKVAWFKDAANFNYQRTAIVDWRGNVSRVSQLALYLGVDPSKIIVYDRKEKKIDASVIIGHDWPELSKRLQ